MRGPAIEGTVVQGGHQLRHERLAQGWVEGDTAFDFGDLPRPIQDQLLEAARLLIGHWDATWGETA